jgi:hypothetical protein
MYGDLYSERHDDCPDNNDTIKKEREREITIYHHHLVFRQPCIS